MPTPSGSTPTLHIPYLLETDIPDIATATQDMALAIEAAIVAVSNTPFATAAAYAVPGPIAVASGALNYLPPFFVPVLGAQSVTLQSVTVQCRSGSCVVAIEQNAVAVSGLSGVSVGTTKSTTAASSPPSIANEDELSVVVASVSGTPDGLSVTFNLEITP